MELYRIDNTEGYSQYQLDSLNKKWLKIVEEYGLDEYTDEYNIRASQFADDVARGKYTDE